jgi:hypothetical protein
VPRHAGCRAGQSGGAWIQKTPDITTRMMPFLQTRLTAVMPNILELIKKRIAPQQ